MEEGPLTWVGVGVSVVEEGGGGGGERVLAVEVLEGREIEKETEALRKKEREEKNEEDNHCFFVTTRTKPKTIS